jgi:hypothetical protein
VAFRQVEGQEILVKPQSSEVMVLNGTGALVWSLLDGTRNVDEVAAAVAAQYQIPLETALSDVQDLLRELIEAGVAHTAD